MNENVIKFFERYNAEPELRERVRAAEAVYPGSSEIREAYAEATLLPVAREEGLEFTLKDLRAYETRLKLRRGERRDKEEDYFDEDEDTSYWLLDRGWSSDEAKFYGTENDDVMRRGDEN